MTELHTKPQRKNQDKLIDYLSFRKNKFRVYFIDLYIVKRT